MSKSIQEFIEEQAEECVKNILDRYASSPQFALFVKLLVMGSCMKSVNFVLQNEVKTLREETDALNSYKKMPDFMKGIGEDQC